MEILSLFILFGMFAVDPVDEVLKVLDDTHTTVAIES